MIKPDVVVTWPNGFDYPPFREQMTEYSSVFNRILICLYPHRDPDIKPFLRNHFAKAEIIESVANDETWREAAVNAGIEKSSSEWILFTEQDFFWTEHFINKTLNSNMDALGITVANRLHPCFLLVKRALIDETSRDFSVHGLDKDHFYQFSKDLIATGKFTDLTKLDLVERRDWYHLSSMTWNLERILSNKGLDEFHNAEDFSAYMALSLKCKNKPQFWTEFEDAYSKIAPTLPIRENGHFVEFANKNLEF